MIQAIQDHRHLFPGRCPVRRKGSARRAVDDPQLISHSDIPGIGGGIRKGGRHRLGEARNSSVAQGPHQHGRHLLPGDGIRGAEGIGLAGNGPVGVGSLHRAEIPGVRVLHILIGALLGCHHLPVEKAAQHHCESSPGHGMPHTEGGGALSLEPALLDAALDGRRCPTGSRHIPERSGRRRHRRHAAQQAHQKRPDGDPPNLHLHAHCNSFCVI